MSRLQEVADQLGEVFDGYFSELHELRMAVEAGLARGDEIDPLVFGFVGPG